MGFAGLDVLAIRHLARQLDTQAGEVDSSVREVDQLIRATEWYGADSRRFLEQWETAHAAELRRAAGLLREASQLASRGASNQEQASRS